ncbi:MAG: NADH dehydrogenase [ubiquinone] 1 alpha subcomplex assembly factor 1 [Myxococcota bacterium]|jgi:NADH dehydrogenase [ubiquinone] 1 alpha subcomplex assembly factor 1
MLLADFRDPAEATRWRTTDDVVMGGCSSSSMRAGDTLGIFAGEVSLERGGGFASVRRRDERIDLSDFDAIELRVRGDGRRYKLNLRTTDHFDGVVYQAAFETRPGRWLAARLVLAEFAPRFRGRPVAGTLNRAHVSSLGLLISDRQSGPFRLELSSISATFQSGR